MAKLVTGGTGFIGSCLVDELLERGEEVLVTSRRPTTRWDGANRKPKIITADISNMSELLNVFKGNNVDCVFHLAAMLSLPCEANPWAAFNVNAYGTMNVLEAVRLFDVDRIVMASTGGTFGADIDAPIITDTTLQRPVTMYGTTKVFAELLGRFYKKKFGTDFRAARIPSVIGPGIRTRAIGQYNSWMIEEPAMGRPYVCYGPPDMGLPVMYFKDAAMAFAQLADAPTERIKTISYNVASMNKSVAPEAIEASVKRAIPDAVISYDPDPGVMEYFAAVRLDVYDDSRARAEWDWQPKYGNIDDMVDDFIKEVRQHPERFGL
jgi:nucleoside-diphosphate-sugar epimerase